MSLVSHRSSYLILETPRIKLRVAHNDGVEDSTRERIKEGIGCEFSRGKKRVHEVIDVLSNVFRDGFRFPPNLDHVGGDEHEYDLKSNF